MTNKIIDSVQSVGMRMYSYGKQDGFSLIEMMIAMAIIGILAAVAYPSYTEHVRKGVRSECRAFLLDIAGQQERFFSQNVSYAKMSDLGYSAGDTSPDGNCKIKSFTLDPSGCSSAGTKCRTYELTVEPVRPDSHCSTLSYTSANVKKSTGSYASASEPLKCWR